MSVDEIVSAYGAAWLEPAEEQRCQLLAQAWAEDGTYTDPIRHVEGRDALSQTIAAFQLGYAPDAWDELSKRLVEKRGFRPDELEAGPGNQSGKNSPRS